MGYVRVKGLISDMEKKTIKDTMFLADISVFTQRFLLS